MRSPIKKPAKIPSTDNSKTSHGIFVISIKPATQTIKWLVFHLECMVEILLDKKQTILEIMQTPLKIDFSTGDVITPMRFSIRSSCCLRSITISILAYNLETVLAEKLETLLARGTANTRMRDFYDIFALENTQWDNIEKTVLKSAFANTSENRVPVAVVAKMDIILDVIENSPDMIALWIGYQRKFEYAADIAWSDVMQVVRKLCAEMK